MLEQNQQAEINVKIMSSKDIWMRQIETETSNLLLQ